MKGWLLRILILVLVICLAAGWWLWRDMQQQLHSPMPMDTQANLVVNPGTSLRALSHELVERGWLDQAYYLRFYARWMKLGHRIKAGEYIVQPGITPVALLEKLVAGDVIRHSLTLIEGWNYRDAFLAVRAHERIDKTLDPDLVDDPAGLMRALDLEQKHPEGQFYPDTYYFPNGTTDVEILQRAYHAMQETLAHEWQQRADNLPYENAYEALIMASIIEKETAVPEERSRIAGVFVRRLQKGMRLQTDPTVIYALGQNYDGNISHKDLKIDSPYNTYVVTGLPPTPIALPGRAAIHAALHPAAGEALYFVARGDGSHYFSDSLQEHNLAVAKYQRGRDIELPKEK